MSVPPVHNIPTDRHGRYDHIVTPTSSAIQRILGNPTSNVFASILADPDCPPRLMYTWAEAICATTPDSDWFDEPIGRVAQTLTHNPSCPPDILKHMASSGYAPVRTASLASPYLPEDIWQQKLGGHDYRPGELEGILDNPRMWDQQASQPMFQHLTDSDYATSDVLQLVVRHPNCPADVLNRLAENHHDHIRLGVAAHANTPPATLTLLAQDHDFGVRLAIAWNEYAPGEALAVVLDSSHPQILQAVLDNPNCPNHIKAIAALGS